MQSKSPYQHPAYKDADRSVVFWMLELYILKIEDTDSYNQYPALLRRAKLRVLLWKVLQAVKNNTKFKDEELIKKVADEDDLLKDVYSMIDSPECLKLISEFIENTLEREKQFKEAGIKSMRDLLDLKIYNGVQKTPRVVLKEDGTIDRKKIMKNKQKTISECLYCEDNILFKRVPLKTKEEKHLKTE